MISIHTQRKKITIRFVYCNMEENKKINNIVRGTNYDLRVSYEGNGKNMINSTSY